MNKIALLSVVILAFVVGFLIFYNSKPISTISSAQQKWETKIDDQGNVSVVVTPLDLSSESAEWKFDVGMNTHSVELDQDMMKIAVLVDDQGREYKPLAWEGPMDKHHREGVLTFARILPAPKSVELKITGIADVVRSFVWQLK